MEGSQENGAIPFLDTLITLQADGSLSNQSSPINHKSTTIKTQAQSTQDQDPPTL